MMRSCAASAVTLCLILAMMQVGAARGQAPRTATNQPAATAPTLPEGVKVERDIPYVTGGGNAQRLDLYLPTRSEKPLPLVIWVFGGGWLSGDKAGRWQPALPLVPKGFAVAAINYRLSEEAKWPAQIEDCKAAVRFLRANAAKYGLDADRFGAWGNSAGGHLVALLGTSGQAKDFDVGEHLDVSSQVQAVCDWYGPTDLFALTVEVLHAPAQKWAAVRKPLEGLFGVELAETDEVKNKMASANPIKYVGKDSPPFLIMHGKADPVVPISQSQLLVDALKNAGADATFKELAAGHGDGDFNKPAAEDAVEAFFEKQLRK